MPEIRLQHVVSCSSEDPTHKAENLLLADTYRKWRCSNCGEKQNSVILQFEKAELIHSIDIGNEGSAFVEVLVGNSTSACEQDFEVILVSSFFMSPTESRSGTNLNRVRMFGPDKLAKGVLGKKWDRVKVVCTQPYNKNLPYGLSFIKFHSTPEADEKTPNSYTAKVTKLGQFVVKEEGSTESLRPGSLFFNRVTRPSTTTADHLTPKTEPTLGKRKAGAEGKQSAPSAPTPDFHSILGGTVLVLSGFQNPFRSELRDKALEMGARYRSDWDPECTHLICAFANTPKYTQVKALGGTVVRKDWILDCYKRRRRLSHKRYLLDRPASSSEEDEGDEEPRPPAQTAHGKAPQLETQSEQQDAVPSTSRQSERMATPERVYEGSTDEETEGAQRTVDDDSGCDTEDEIKRVQDHLQKQQEEESDPYAASTDENTDVEDTAPEISLPIPELPDLFVGKHFLLYGEFPNNERRLLTRYITAFNGSLEDYMSESVNFVVTAEDWDDRFDEALMENSNLAFVRPRWVYTCNEKQKLVPHQPYVVVPSI
ncbi:DNA repair protein XRCC1 isoform X5 [Hypanus sabinus]|uniref:DNA repair protein XRCC1 isoform X5 n=1 Tax=Hypanus sabinus TaxID=79690 RepID=UPI0028C4ADA6|nr:DNA repair protein XRCC1 isoform X5 [Hypanus sabinus]